MPVNNIQAIHCSRRPTTAVSQSAFQPSSRRAGV